jgi:hypothetical protein
MGKEATMAKLSKPVKGYWTIAAVSGVVAGIAMLVYAGLAERWFGAGLWLPVDVLVRPTVVVPGYAGLATWVGVAVHLLTAAVWGLGYGAFLALLSTYGPARMDRSWTVAALLGLGWGVVAYLMMGLAIAPALNPKAFLLHPATFFVAHLVFGLVTALGLTSAARRARPTVTFAPEAPVRTRTRR